MRVELISPACPVDRVKEVGGAGCVPPLGLALLAALTPSDVDVSITDEAFDCIDFERPVDLVGITAMTTVAPRAFEIAGNYLRRGVPVVMGGVHPTLVPDECLPHATSIVQGEGERLWPQIIRDAQQGNLKKIYREDNFLPLTGLPPPRFDLIKNRKAYPLFNTVQATRGCTHRCSFCTVASIYKGTFRSRPVEDVLRDIGKCEGNHFFFVDDNMVVDHQYARHLFREMIPLRKNWMTEMELSVADDEELLDLAARAGCRGIYIGFESISPQALKEINKGARQYRQIPAYREKIDRIRSFGIGTCGGFIFGCDSDTPDVFRRTLDFVLSSNLDVVQFQTLNVFPGTPLFRRMEREGRILHRDWSKYVWRYITYLPKQMSPEEIEDGILQLYRSYYSLPQLAKRSINWLHHRSAYSWVIALMISLGYRKRKDA